MPFTFLPTSISAVVRIQPRVFRDERGCFLEVYKSSEFATAGIDLPCVQVNHSRSVRGVVRGLHFQITPAAQAKLVRVIRGAVWDVAVDVRPDSTTFTRWVAVELTEDNRELLYIPEGFAHGFAVLSDDAELEYTVSHEYSPQHERGIIWNDPDLAIDWPVDQPLVSAKDAGLPVFRNLFAQSAVPPRRSHVANAES